MANVTLSLVHNPISNVAVEPLSRVKVVAPCAVHVAVSNAELNTVKQVLLTATVGLAAVLPIIIESLAAVTLHTVPDLISRYLYLTIQRQSGECRTICFL